MKLKGDEEKIINSWRKFIKEVQWEFERDGIAGDMKNFLRLMGENDKIFMLTEKQIAQYNVSLSGYTPLEKDIFKQKWKNVNRLHKLLVEELSLIDKMYIGFNFAQFRGGIEGCVDSPFFKIEEAYNNKLLPRDILNSKHKAYIFSGFKKFIEIIALNRIKQKNPDLVCHNKVSFPIMKYCVALNNDLKKDGKSSKVASSKSKVENNKKFNLKRRNGSYK